ncbi:MAG: hypothetical protein R8G66_06015 [Cytophagales bacterium]|nr:hypothetical protein [Cytophagales bacterium]
MNNLELLSKITDSFEAPIFSLILSSFRGVDFQLIGQNDEPIFLPEGSNVAFRISGISNSTFPPREIINDTFEASIIRPGSVTHSVIRNGVFNTLNLPNSDGSIDVYLMDLGEHFYRIKGKNCVRDANNEFLAYATYTCAIEFPLHFDPRQHLKKIEIRNGLCTEQLLMNPLVVISKYESGFQDEKIFHHKFPVTTEVLSIDVNL